jgi:DNA polymerase I-like protein with 3'-5' exonuclease and polymerase domains
LEPYQALVNYGDGRVRPTIYTLGTDTGRMSCVRPNLQQCPRTGGVRACITADPDHALVSADFSGVELRVAAALSGDAALARIIAEDDAAKAIDPTAKTDIHWRIAREVYGPEATKLDRSNTKRGVFGRLYGAGIPGIARTLRIRESEAAAVAETLDAMTPGLAAWAKQLRKAVEAGRTQFRTYSGRVVYLPEGSPHKAVNYAVQGTGRELLVDALLRWRDTPWGRNVLLPVHDEIIVMVPKPDATAATSALVECMHTTFHGVPIVAEADEPTLAWADAA